MQYRKPTSIDCASVGNLYQARDYKRRMWAGVKSLRARLREANRRPGGGAGQIRLDLIRVESAHADAQLMELGALRAIEERANELGLTTDRTKATE